MSLSIRQRPSYTLGVLTLAYVFAYLDRQVLSLLVEPIRADLNLSDVQIGLLQGFAFALVLALGGLPAGRWVDRGNRIQIAAIAITFWSIMTAACGFADSFEALLVCRAGVALGEAALVPAAYSLISDRFPIRRRGLAIGFFTSGAFIGAGLSLILAATVLHQLSLPGAEFLLPGTTYAWQSVFILFGLPGLAVALWVANLEEPRRNEATPAKALPSAGEVRAYFIKRRTELLTLYFCLGFTGMHSYGYSAWVPTMLIRKFELPPSDIGFVLGPLFIGFSLAGLLLGATLGDKLVRRGVQAGRPLLMVVGASGAALSTAALPLMTTLETALAMISATSFFATIVIANGPAALQDITPSRMRGISSVVGVMVVTLLGMGLGPSLVGFISQEVLGDKNGIGVALAIVSTGALMMSSVLALVAALNYRLDLDSEDKGAGSGRVPRF
jgi:MFS family permease